MAVIDTFTFNGETQMLKLHLAIMDKYVDKFIIVEADKTFSGKDKPMHFFRTWRYFEEYGDKIEYFIVNDWDDSNLWEQAIKSPNTQTMGADHWRREFYIKESIHKALKQCKVKDEDTVLIGDVDEIIDPEAIYASETPIKAKLRVYTYFLNNRSTEAFWGTLIAQYKDVKGKCLNHMRSDQQLYSEGPMLGWHFTSMGGVDKVLKKFDDSYTEDSYNSIEIRERLPECIQNGRDFLGRPFEYQIDESEWPQYLKDNKRKFMDLCA